MGAKNGLKYVNVGRWAGAQAGKKIRCAPGKKIRNRYLKNYLSQPLDIWYTA
jgi:hypothetical protein